MAKSKDGQNKKKMKISTVLIFFFCSIVAFTMLVQIGRASCRERV